MNMLEKLKNVIYKLDALIKDVEDNPERKVAKVIGSFSKNMKLMKDINDISASGDKIDRNLIITSMKANADKIKTLEEYIKVARTNLLNIAEVNAHLTDLKDDSEFLLKEIDMQADNLEVQVMKLIPLLKDKTDEDIASYIRGSLNRVGELTSKDKK